MLADLVPPLKLELDGLGGRTYKLVRLLRNSFVFQKTETIFDAIPICPTSRVGKFPLATGDSENFGVR